MKTLDSKLTNQTVVVEGTIDKGQTTLEIIETEIEETLEEMYPLDMSEGQIQNVLHGMVDQKVEAKDNWLFTPMTTPRIGRILELRRMNTSMKRHT
ncbi:hypothetical protein ACFFH4_17335 [Halalkalibacter alkalisediminis]|uniref:Uncharacterized protein n=1 Tax=Halalkalibacter alkalisediminis TaxID=935616 RepID=A0ABV6NJ13_9BACI